MNASTETPALREPFNTDGGSDKLYAINRALRPVIAIGLDVRCSELVIAEALAQLAMKARAELIEIGEGTTPEIECETASARAILTGIAAAAWFTTGGTLTERDSDTPSPVGRLHPDAKAAQDDLEWLCSVAEDLWPNPWPEADHL